MRRGGALVVLPGPLQQARGITSNSIYNPFPSGYAPQAEERLIVELTFARDCQATARCRGYKVDLRGTSVLDVHHPTRETTHSAWQLVYVLLAGETSLWARPRLSSCPHLSFIYLSIYQC